MRDYNVLGSHIRAASGKYDEAAKKLEGISGKLQSIADENYDSQGASSAASQKDSY